ncbi:hypothetical protein FB567DRAFT_455514, partial [Paraphoma chrysanthemicola]
FSSENDGYTKSRAVYVTMWCERHNRVERLFLAHPNILAISLFREKGLDFWSKMLLSDTERSHLCHYGDCEAPTHILREHGKLNRSRIQCQKRVNKYLKNGKLLDEAVRRVRQKCPHPITKCFLEGSIPCATLEQTREHLHDTLRKVVLMTGYCSTHNVDFPIHVARTLNFKNMQDSTPFYDQNTKLRDVERARKSLGAAQETRSRPRTILELRIRSLYVHQR